MGIRGAGRPPDVVENSDRRSQEPSAYMATRLPPFHWMKEGT
jgi:hypothetical protein